MFTVRRAQIEELARDAARRARSSWLDSLRAQGLAAHEDSKTGRIEIKDAAGGRAIVQFLADGISVTSGEKGPAGEERSYRFQYDSNKSVRSVTDPAGLRVVFDYDERKRLTAVHRGTFGRFTFLYDSADNLAGIRYPDNSLARMNYDQSGRLAESVDRNGHSRQFEYSPYGLPSHIIGPKDEITSFEYGSQGFPNAVVSALGDRQTYEDDGLHGGMIVRHNERQVVSFFVDPETGTQEFHYADGTLARFGYTEGRLTTATNGACTVNLTYDSNGYVRTEETDGRAVEYERNALGAIMALVTPEGERIAFERDTEHRLRKIRERSDKTYTIDYELSGALASIEYPNGIVVKRTCNPLGYPESLTVRSGATPLLDIVWEYDACDRLKAETPAGGARREFHYDREGRLEQVGSPGARGVEESYVLDPNGNRVSDRGVPCSVNALDQLVQKGDDEFRYDAQGNMIEGFAPTGRIRCKYNGRGQLVEAVTAQQVTRYTYDAFGRRVIKEEPGRVTRYTWAGQWLLSEIVEEKGRASRRDYLVVPDLGVALAQREDGSNYYPHYGKRLEPLMMTDDRGRVVWSAKYDAFGSARIEISHVSLALRLPGQYFDAETGLHYSLARYYDPHLGRYLQRDPLGYDGGSWDEYIYCDGDPLNRCDPTGEFLPLIILAGAGIGAGVAAGIEIYRQKKANPDAPLNWGKVGKEALIGGTIGAIGAGVGAALAPLAGALGTGLAAAMSGGALVGGTTAAVETCAEAAIRGQPIHASQVLGSALFGATIGAVTAGVGGLLARRARRLAIAAEEARVAARSTADLAQAEGRTSGVASALRVGDETFPGVSTGGVNRVNHPNVQRALDQVPRNQRSPFHGECAEIDSLNRAAEAGMNPRGGTMQAVKIRGPGHTAHATPKAPCPSCRAVMNQLGVNHD